MRTERRTSQAHKLRYTEKLYFFPMGSLDGKFIFMALDK